MEENNNKTQSQSQNKSQDETRLAILVIDLVHQIPSLMTASIKPYYSFYVINF
jgi:hypothetical protein